MYPFRDDSFAVYNGWYVAAFAADVKQSLVARTILNQPVVLYRKQNGEAVAVGGRCPHRHFPLGKSCLKGDEIECGYHGITFGPDGRCTRIPAQSFVPPTYKIPTYPLIEHGMWLWIWPGDPQAADPALLPDLAEIGYSDPGLEAHAFYMHEVGCRYQLLNDNLLDLSHIGYLHGTTIGTAENATTPEVLTKRPPGFLSCRRYIRDAPAPAAMAALRGYSGTIDRTVGMDFYLPGFHAGIGESFYPRGHERAGEMLNRSRIYHAVTPSTPERSYYFFGLAAPPTEDFARTKEYLRAVIQEDIVASEEIEKMLRLVGHPSELMIKSDQNAVEGRRMLQRMMDAEGAQVLDTVRARARV